MFNFQRNIREIRGVQFRLTETSSGECFTGFGVFDASGTSVPKREFGNQEFAEKVDEISKQLSPAKEWTRNNFPILQGAFPPCS